MAKQICRKSLICGAYARATVSGWIKMLRASPKEAQAPHRASPRMRSQNRRGRIYDETATCTEGPNHRGLVTDGDRSERASIGRKLADQSPSASATKGDAGFSPPIARPTASNAFVLAFGQLSDPRRGRGGEGATRNCIRGVREDLAFDYCRSGMASPRWGDACRGSRTDSRNSNEAYTAITRNRAILWA